MARSRVLLPEPLGPMITTFSPVATDIDTLLSARRGPKNLLTFSMRMMGSGAFIIFQLLFHDAHQFRQNQCDEQIDQGDHGESFKIEESLRGEFPAAPQQ